MGIKLVFSLSHRVACVTSTLTNSLVCLYEVVAITPNLANCWVYPPQVTLQINIQLLCCWILQMDLSLHMDLSSTLDTSALFLWMQWIAELDSDASDLFMFVSLRVHQNSRMWRFMFFAGFGKFQAIISLNFLIWSFLSFPSGTLTTHILESHKSWVSVHVFFILFLSILWFIYCLSIHVQIYQLFLLKAQKIRSTVEPN